MRTIQAIYSITALCLLLVCCGKSDITEEVSLERGQAYYYFKISRMHDGSKEFDLLPYASGFTGEKRSIKTRRGLIGDEIDLIYVVDIPASKTAKELRAESKDTIERIKKVADFTLDIKTWDER